MAEEWTKTSWPPSTAMKPKPFSALNHFTVPCATCAPTFRACGRPPHRPGRPGRALPPVEHERGTEPRQNVQHKTPGETRLTHTAHQIGGGCPPDPGLHPTLR